MKRLFFPWKTQQKKARFAHAPHDNFYFYFYAARCTEILYFQIAAAKLIIKDMIKNRYLKEKLRNTLPGTYFQNAFYEKSPITENIKDVLVNKPRARDLYWYKVEKELWDRINS